MSKQSARLRRAIKTRARIRNSSDVRLVVSRSNKNISAQVIVQESTGDKVVASVSTMQADIKSKLKGNKTEQAKLVGQLVAEQATKAGISKLAFDRSGFLYHGRVKALAEGARESGIEF